MSIEACPFRTALVSGLLALQLATQSVSLPAQDCIPGNPRLTIENPAPGTGDFFGHDLAVSGNLLLVGAYADNPTGVRQDGTAYIFDARTGQPLRPLLNPAPAGEEAFGFTVDLSGDLAVVGDPFDDPGGLTNSGTAYVFNANTGALVQTIKNPAPALDDRFAEIARISDGLVLIGAPFKETEGFPFATLVYVFDALTGDLRQTLRDPIPRSGSSYGAALAIDGELAIVGAFTKTIGSVEESGVAFVFNVTTGALISTLEDPNPLRRGWAGRSVGISGDLAAVGVQKSSLSDLRPARVLVFNARTGDLISTLNHPKGIRSDLYATAVDIHGGTVIVGAPLDGPSTGSPGVVYMFDAFSAELYAVIDNPSAMDDALFGHSVSLSKDWAAVGVIGGSVGNVPRAGLVNTLVNCDYGTLNRMLSVLLGSYSPEFRDDFTGDGEVDIADLVTLISEKDKP